VFAALKPGGAVVRGNNANGVGRWEKSVVIHKATLTGILNTPSGWGDFAKIGLVSAKICKAVGRLKQFGGVKTA
jgi:hypothetical protein